MSEAPLALDIRGLSFAYGADPVLQDVNVQLEQGASLGVFGPNGGGKTTLLRLILGLERPESGSIRVLGTSPERAAPSIGYVPQRLNAQPGLPLSVLEAVRLGQVRATLLRGSDAAARAALAQVDMEWAALEPFAALSGGQQQRVMIARALVNQPRMLILDEPTANVDPRGTFCFFEFLTALREHCTLLIVSHNPGLAASPAISRIACINRRVLLSDDRGFTPEMSALLYGDHDPASCDYGAYSRAESELISSFREQQL